MTDDSTEPRTDGVEQQNDSTGRREPTRRDCVRYGSALVAGGLLAGCTGGGGDTAETSTRTTTTATTESTTETTDGTTTTAESETTTAGDAAYSVTMSPMGTVEFDAVPERIFTRLTHLAGMAFALGRGDDVNAMHAPGYYHALWNQFTPRLDGVSLDWQGLYSSWEPGPEKLHDLDSDVHLADPASVLALGSWSQSDLETVAENVGPWFGNSLSARHQEPPSAWPGDYEYLGLWEQFEKVAAVFQEEARYEELAAVREGLLETIEAGLPPERERPTVAMAGLTDVQSPYVYTADAPGFLTAHTRPLGPVDAFGGDVSSGDQVDVEAMVDADPDVILALGGMHPDTSMPDIRAALDDDDAGRRIAAVENDRVYAQGARYQGPILNLFQLEMTAKQLYPGQFGEWPVYEDGPYPEIPAEEQLFDRERVAAAIRGEVEP